ncbi:HPr family phosphocarrier protein [Terribacillus sp. 7520-G]|uniref:HPr family phosphocarrier protein n=1 Tax=Terribacillus TaxID=459532 RepID=UPI000BA5C06E|nr:HPr family phosphocarrier protein [Terribacillus sp. 7520-G]PAD38012.1 HPr family phosphocarrier protein [Terribacillus sp. 7520-G]
MLMTKLSVRIPRGLQARNTAIFVSRACAFTSDVIISKDGVPIDGKEIMKVMDLHVKTGDEITLIVDGDDEKLAIDTLKEFLTDQ